MGNIFCSFKSAAKSTSGIINSRFPDRRGRFTPTERMRVAFNLAVYHLCKGESRPAKRIREGAVSEEVPLVLGGSAVYDSLGGFVDLVEWADGDERPLELVIPAGHRASGLRQQHSHLKHSTARQARLSVCAQLHREPRASALRCRRACAAVLAPSKGRKNIFHV